MKLWRPCTVGWDSHARRLSFTEWLPCSMRLWVQTVSGIDATACCCVVWMRTDFALPQMTLCQVSVVLRWLYDSWQCLDVCRLVYFTACPVHQYCVHTALSLCAYCAVFLLRCVLFIYCIVWTMYNVSIYYAVCIMCVLLLCTVDILCFVLCSCCTVYCIHTAVYIVCFWTVLQCVLLLSGHTMLCTYFIV